MFAREFYPAIFGALFRSGSWIAMVMITDLAGAKNASTSLAQPRDIPTGRAVCIRPLENSATVTLCTASFGSYASCSKRPGERRATG